MRTRWMVIFVSLWLVGGVASSQSGGTFSGSLQSGGTFSRSQHSGGTTSENGSQHPSQHSGGTSSEGSQQSGGTVSEDGSQHSGGTVSGRPHSGGTTPEDGTTAAQRYFTDVVLINQDGEEMRFYSDLLRGKVVIIDTMFTTCMSVCPTMHRTFARLQEWLGDRLGRDVYMLSITVDPANDTPDKLRAYADKLAARQGWYFLTGEKENLTLALRKLGQHVESRDDHSTVFLIGNEPTGLWKKALGMASADDIVRIVDSVLNDQG